MLTVAVPYRKVLAFKMLKFSVDAEKGNRLQTIIVKIDEYLKIKCC